jgi:hypothetical protein
MFFGILIRTAIIALICPVAVSGHGAERDAHDVVLVDFELRDQVDVKGGCALVRR